MNRFAVDDDGTILSPAFLAGRGVRWQRIFRGLLAALTGVILVLLLSGLLWMREKDAAHTQFLRDATERNVALQQALDDQLDSVATIAAYFQSSQSVDQKEFHSFNVPILRKYSGLQALAWAPRTITKPHAKESEPFTDHAKSNQTEKIAGPTNAKSDHEEYPILFVEPFSRNKSLIGVDLASGPQRLSAIRKAMSTGRPTAVVHSAFEKLLSGRRNTMLLIVPVLSEETTAKEQKADQPLGDGVVLGVFQIDALVDASLRYVAPVGFDLYITASTRQSDKTLVYMRLSPVRDSGDAMPSASDWPGSIEGRTSMTANLDIADTRWTLNVVPTDSYLARQRTWIPGVVLLAGLMVTGLVSGYFQLISGRTIRVERLIAQRTRELRKSERRFRRLVENAGDAFFLHDERGRILDANQQACDSLGYSREELLSMSVPDIEVKDTSPYLTKPPTQYPFNYEGIEIRKDGSTFPVEVRFTLLDNSTPRTFLALVRDMTERKHFEKTLRDGERKLRAILDQTYGFVGMLTPDGVIMEANKTALAFCGITEDDVRGKPFWDTPWWAHSPALQEELQRSIQRAAKGEFIRMEVTHPAADGELHWIDFSLKPVKDDTGKVLFMIPEGRDITDRKQAEEAIRQERRLLRDMLDLNEQDRKLVAYEIHDGLAQELTAAVFKFQAVEQFRDSDPDAAREVFDEGLQALRKGLTETRRLINGLRPPVLDAAGAVAAIDDLIAGHAQHEGPAIEFIHPEEVCRLAPPLETAVFRIVQECLTNACRYSQSEKVRVELAQIDGRMHVNVEDWGIGFDPATVKGDHFGLRGIRERVRLLGGAVRIESAPQKGTHILAELPVILPMENGFAKNGGGGRS